jgi:hypothetical protein
MLGIPLAYPVLYLFYPLVTTPCRRLVRRIPIKIKILRLCALTLSFAPLPGFLTVCGLVRQRLRAALVSLHR